MRLLVSSAQARILDRQTIDWGIAAEVLMEVAASKMWDCVRDRFPDPKRPLLILAGPGHNGGDALALGRFALSAGCKRVGALVVSNPLKPLTQRQLVLFERCGGSLLTAADLPDYLEDAPILIEGISGAGRLPEQAKDWRHLLQHRHLPKIALDLPCGLEEGPLYAADLTLCVSPLKREIYVPKNRQACGRVRSINLEWPVPLLKSCTEASPIRRYTLGDLPSLLRRHRPTAFDHKGVRGRVAVLAGGANMLGAGQLAARAAALVAGVVEWYVPPESLSTAQNLVLGPIVLPRNPGQLEASLPRLDSILIGPGLDEKSALELLPLSLSRGIPLVLDAGALSPDWQRLPPEAPCVLTPHPGELARMLGSTTQDVLADPLAALNVFPNDWVVVLKSQPLWIKTEGGFHVLDVQNPSLGFGGSGDILAGLVSAFAARYRLDTATLLAVSLHQFAARRALRNRWLTPSNLLDELERTLMEVYRA